MHPELVGLVPDAALKTLEEDQVEAPVISGIAHDRSQDKITIVGIADAPGMAARLFQIVAAAGANIDMIVQNIPTSGTGRANISFTLPGDDAERTIAAIEAAKDELDYQDLRYSPGVGILSLVGAGMRTNPGVSAKLFGSLSDAGINIDMITTSEIRISVVTKLEDLDRAVRAVHSAFGLDSTESEAVVYGGTGR